MYVNDKRINASLEHDAQVSATVQRDGLTAFQGSHDQKHVEVLDCTVLSLLGIQQGGVVNQLDRHVTRVATQPTHPWHNGGRIIEQDRRLWTPNSESHPR